MSIGTVLPPSAIDAAAPSRMSTTWAACSALARCGRPSAIAPGHLGDAARPRHAAERRPDGRAPARSVPPYRTEFDESRRSPGGCRAPATRRRRGIRGRRGSSPAARRRSSSSGAGPTPSPSSTAATMRSGLPIRNDVAIEGDPVRHQVPAPGANGPSRARASRSPGSAGRPRRRRGRRRRRTAPAPGASARSGPTGPPSRRPAPSRAARSGPRRPPSAVPRRGTSTASSRDAGRARRPASARARARPRR